MPLAKDIKNDIKAGKKIWLPWWAVLCLIIGALPVVWLFDHFGKLNLFLPTFNCIAVLGFAIAVKRKLRRHTWFWGMMTILAALHVPLILFVPWTTKWVPATAIAAIDSADLIVMLTILSVVGKFMEGSKTAEMSAPRF
ncbi:MAG: hypothetical protein DMG60_12985 [Acidobacteria bacterium]|nr:MAG: hypothetical protein DMG60_12985 [Acidobacteriota bacterium]